ncbi:hypothetical protein [Neobacillus cucumis]|uniref:hypothetical protein n=1 Tax=Neobacillus cucumis TaxID=1740721 RepID=UPI002853318A|nr:hypothetical protein [Neobacillus cucumis]MDR4948108.1 hypothetical protein [Neobacillus cucumis]
MKNEPINQEEIPMMYLTRMQDLTTIEEMVNYIEEFSENYNNNDMEIFRADNSDEDYGPLSQGRIGICLGCTYFRGYGYDFVGCNTEEERDVLEEMWTKALNIWEERGKNLKN